GFSSSKVSVIEPGLSRGVVTIQLLQTPWIESSFQAIY
ncbi:MAG: hypothetical protein RLZZ575_224, partial [Actinomycetota bacterium]